MKDYTLDPNFWIRLQMFVSETNVNCMMDDEEKEMILHNCKLKIEELTDIELSDDEFEKNIGRVGINQIICIFESSITYAGEIPAFKGLLK